MKKVLLAATMLLGLSVSSQAAMITFTTTGVIDHGEDSGAFGVHGQLKGYTYQLSYQFDTANRLAFEDGTPTWEYPYERDFQGQWFTTMSTRLEVNGRVHEYVIGLDGYYFNSFYGLINFIQPRFGAVPPNHQIIDHIFGSSEKYTADGYYHTQQYIYSYVVDFLDSSDLSSTFGSGVADLGDVDVHVRNNITGESWFTATPHSFSVVNTPIPEPASLLLLGMGLGGLGIIRNRRFM